MVFFKIACLCGIKNDIMLLYDTKTGNCMDVALQEAITLVTQMRKPGNLGVILFDSEDKYNADIITFVQDVIEQQFGDLWDYMENQQKPVRLYPILNLQRDVDRLNNENGRLLLGKDIINYLLELNVYLHDYCNKSCKHCNDYCKQIKCCTSTKLGNELPIECFEKIYNQIKYSPIEKINILGGNLQKFALHRRITKL